MNRMEEAREWMTKYIEIGEAEEGRLLKVVADTVIQDKLVPPRSMKFELDGPLLALRFSPELRTSIHRHAFGQLCQKVSLPMNFANMLRQPDRLPEDWLAEHVWKVELLAHNLNELFHQPSWKDGETRFLHRIVGTELRGFLSRRYNRFLASAPLLRSFVDVCRVQGAKPIDATASPVRSSLKYIMPEVYEPFPGEYICVGIEWSNSDFGAGKLAVCQTIWRVRSRASVVLDETISRVHLGGIIQDSDLEISDDTARKEVVAQQSAIADVVVQLLSSTTVERLLTAMKTAHEEEIPWSKLRAQLRILNKSEVEWMESTLQSGAMGIIDLPPVSFAPDNTPQPNAYWAAATLSLLATQCGDADRKLELQREAGKLLGTSLKS